MKLLVLLSRFPYPLDKGDKLRAFHQLRYLAGQGHDICLLALSDEPVPAEALAAVRPLCRGGLHLYQLGRLGRGRGLARALATAGRPLQVGYFYEQKAQQLVDKLLAEFRPNHVYCQLIRMAEYLRPHAGRYPMTLDYMDVFSAGMARRAATAPAWQRPVLALEARRLAAYEAAAYGWFGHHTIISEQDRQLIQHPQKDKITVVPNGIDFTYFQPQPQAEKPATCFSAATWATIPTWTPPAGWPRKSCPWCGSSTRRPGCCWPAPRPAPSARAGRLAGGSGQRLAARHPHGLRRGAGVRGSHAGRYGPAKQALGGDGHAVAVRHYPLAHNALGGTPGRHLLVADTAPALADALAGLLADATAAARLAAAGRTFVAETYDWAAATARLENLFLDNC
ncbi:MAG: hypothetical protein WKG07_17810 [Hymenobacter sp.]